MKHSPDDPLKILLNAEFLLNRSLDNIIMKFLFQACSLKYTWFRVLIHIRSTPSSPDTCQILDSNTNKFIGQYWIRKDRVHGTGTRCKKQAKGCFRHFKRGIPVRGVRIYNIRGVLLSDNLHPFPTQLMKGRFVMERDRLLISWQLTYRTSGIRHTEPPGYVRFFYDERFTHVTAAYVLLWSKVKQIWAFGGFVETYIMGCSAPFPRKTKVGELVYMNYETWHEKSGHKR